MQTKINKLAVANSFSAAAATYDQAAIVEQEIGQRLIARLADLSLQPRYILDLGCGTGYFTVQLQQQFPDAIIIGIDLAFGMVNFARQARSLDYCCADAEMLPFANLQFDLIFSNFCLPSISDLPALFIELQRILAANGVLLFSTFGPDTLLELGLDNTWPDMHIIGDILLQNDYKDPVVDMEHLIFNYQHLQTLCDDLQQSGSFNIDLTQVANLHLPCKASYEIIYGMAFKHQKRNKQLKDESGNTYIALDQITFMNTGSFDNSLGYNRNC